MQFAGDIELDPTVLEKHSRDASVFQILPERVIYPKTVNDIASVLYDARVRHTSVAVRAGGTCMSGGSLTHGTVVNLTRYMNKIHVDPLTRLARVEGGVMFADLEHELDKHGLMCASYPSSKDICGVAGMIGNNASGEKSVRYGATIDVTQALEVVLDDGTIIQTRKLTKAELDSAEALETREGELYRSVHALYDKYAQALQEEMGNVGKVASGYRLDRFYDEKSDTYSLTPLFVGAQGTLGIITKAAVSVVPKPKFLSLLAISVSSLDHLPLVVETVMNHDPDAVETFDVNTYRLATGPFPAETEFAKRFFTSATELIVLAEFASDTGLVDTRNIATRCAAALRELGIVGEVIVNEKERDMLWTLRRNSFAVFRDHEDGTRHAVPCIEDIVVPVPALTPLIRNLKDILLRRGLKYGFHGHIGEGSLRILPIFDLADPNVAQHIIDLSRDVFALVKSLHGNMSADHSDGIVRTPFVPEFYPKSHEAFIALKCLFDPLGVLNPGKKVGGTEEDIRKYIVTL